MLTNILVPALGLILLTFVIGLIHTIASVNLMGKGKDWEESGIPIEPYKDAPLHLKIIKNNISKECYQWRHYIIILYVLSAGK